MKKIIIAIVVLALIVIGIFIFKKEALAPTPSQPVIQNSKKSVETHTTALSENTITLTQSGFSPDTLTIKSGTKVTWINKSGVEAKVNSDPHPVHTAYPPLNLGSFADGQSISLTFDKSGTYGYHDHLNPSLTGKIIVQ